MATALIASVFTAGAVQAATAGPAGSPAQKPPAAADGPPPSAIPLKDRDTVLGKGWKTSSDRAVTAASDSDGLHVLVADSPTGYAWKTVAVLTEPQVPADAWIGNLCVMDDHHAAVVYAPRTFTNKPDLMMGGAFTGVVDLDDGSVTKLPFTASLAYFDPTCNPHTRTAAFTALRDDRSRLVTVDTRGATVADTTAKGEITSAVPTADGAVAAAGNWLVDVDRKGRVTRLAAAEHAPYSIRVTGDGTVDYIDRTGSAAADVRTFAHGRATTVASGKVTEMDLRQGTDGTVYLTGKAGHGKGFTASGITSLAVSPDAEISTRGRLAVDPVVSPAVLAGLDRIADAGRGFTTSAGAEPAPETVPGDPSHALTVTGTVPGTGKHTRQQAAEPGPGAGGTPSPVLTGSTQPQLATRSTATATADDDSRAHDPVDTDAWCSVPRNDSGILALQPTPNQVEWAVDMAVRGQLRSGYLAQGGWRSQTGLGTIDPQGLFPNPTLSTGGRIPAQVELGILAQESNLWQAESGAIPGQMGNPLAAVDGYYGHQTGGSTTDYWAIHWNTSDCGYGVGQVTDGMRKAGHEKEGETSLPASTQRAIAVDYATNIAASLHILADKWNEIHESGQTIAVNNDDPAKPENWFAAVWNYNLGFNAKADEGTNGNWGLGWYNNPANPVFPASRDAFMNTDLDPAAAKDAAQPQKWPYEEKVMGWAAWSIDTGFSYATSGRQDWPGDSGFSSAGFRPAYWNGSVAGATVEGSANYNRAHVSPPLDTFCNSANNCVSDDPPDCPDADCYTQYWFNSSNATWKSDCDTTCGFENIKYQTLVNEPGRGTRLQHGTPVCSGAPSGALVVDSVPDGTQTWSSCGTSDSSGTFQFTFNADPAATGPGLGQYDAKADLHQIGGGYQGHYWYTHTRNPEHLGGDNGTMTIKGTWTLGQSLDWARVLVHLPDTGAQTRQAAYVVGGADSTSPQRVVLQRAGGWANLGAFHFIGTPRVSLSNTTADGTADEDIAWDAVAFQPLPGKPANSLVAMGDSYSSGEGASANGGDDYYPETDYYNENQPSTEDKCHRSKYAWSRQAVLPGQSQSVGALADSFDPSMDFHFIACSGARHYNIIGDGQNGELGQTAQGYLDNNTTLVTLSVGGNDMRFADIIKKCILSISVCSGASLGAVDPDTGDGIDGQDTGPLDEWAPKWAHDTIRPRIVKTLNEIYKKAPNAEILLMGYPRLLEHMGGCVLGIGTEEAPWLNEMGDTLAKEMQGAVDDADSLYHMSAMFADPRSVFDGKAICGDPEDVNGIVLTGHSEADARGPSWLPGNPMPSMKSFHPKIAGATLYAQALEARLSPP